VTGVKSRRRFLLVDQEELKKGRVQSGSSFSNSAELVSCGSPPPNHEVMIVDPDTGEILEADRVGEIWFAGPSVARGYWRREDDTKFVFESRLPVNCDRLKRCLRTGDLGFVHDGELYITGRLKDLLIVRGRNVAPHEVEDLAQSVSLSLRANAGAAFPIETEDGEGIGLVQETTLKKIEELDCLARLTRRAVLDGLGIPLSGLYLAVPGSVSKTSSGKVRRHATMAALLDGRLAVVYEYEASTAKLRSNQSRNSCLTATI
jgi:acyl-CoA synthetase (AMP-forming)/AMP-acid ligase II